MYSLIENLLSTSPNRDLYEALWFVSVHHGSRIQSSKLNVNNFSVKDICNTIIENWDYSSENQGKFFFSTHLVFGTLYVYKFQIDNFYDQALTTLRSARLELYDINWLSSQQTSTPKQQKITQSLSQKKNLQNRKNKTYLVSKEPQIPFNSNDDDFDSIENFFKILDEPIEAIPKSQKKGKKIVYHDSGIDHTMAQNQQSITIKEPTNATIATTGINSCLNLANIDDFEDDFGTENYQDFLDLFNSSEDVITPIITKTVINDNFIDDSAFVEMPSVNIEANSNQVETFDLHSNNPQTFPQDELINPPIELLPAAQESELILEVIPDFKKTRKNKQPRKLIIDKEIKLKQEQIFKQQEDYRKSVPKTPFAEFANQVNFLKTCVDSLFYTPGSFKNASKTLIDLYRRGSVESPQKPVVFKKRNRKEMENEEQEDKENETFIKRRKTKKTLRDQSTVLKDLNETNLIEEPMELEIPQPNVDVIDNDLVEELVLPPAFENNEKQANSRHCNFNNNKNNSGKYNEGSKITRQQIMSKLKNLWKEKDQSITIEKLTEGLDRFATAGVFFELLILSKLGVIELVNKPNSLEIGHIKCNK